MCRRFICVVLTAILIFSCTSFVNAKDNVDIEISPGIELTYEFTSSANSYLAINNNTAYCKGDLKGYSSEVTQIRITMTLEKKSLLWWNEVESWSAGFRDDSASLSKTYSVSSGTYRVKTVFEVYSGSEFETITSYSSQVEV